MSKRPTGLSNLQIYTQPGNTKNGVRDEDCFVGEEDLMKYLDRQGFDALAMCCVLLISPPTVISLVELRRQQERRKDRLALSVPRASTPDEDGW
ncbi:hypothetical protein GN958_ATG15670 [Phytophthora infestans]|uniref:Uncharacterized protein n=1 Tax=Phytophthora infestans TaxID=4787 RepID=A0A8S9U3C5_PHYIN|nr:hypothetical protein GN958_ATG15670 [Phytophthora infestans]